MTLLESIDYLLQYTRQYFCSFRGRVPTACGDHLYNTESCPRLFPEFSYRTTAFSPCYVQSFYFFFICHVPASCYDPGIGYRRRRGGPGSPRDIKRVGNLSKRGLSLLAGWGRFGTTWFMSGRAVRAGVDALLRVLRGPAGRPCRRADDFS